MKKEQDAGEARWEIEAITRPGTPRAKVQTINDERIVTGPGVYSEVYEALGPLMVRTSKY